MQNPAIFKGSAAICVRKNAERCPVMNSDGHNLFRLGNIPRLSNKKSNGSKIS